MAPIAETETSLGHYRHATKNLPAVNQYGSMTLPGPWQPSIGKSTVRVSNLQYKTQDDRKFIDIDV